MITLMATALQGSYFNFLFLSFFSLNMKKQEINFSLAQPQSSFDNWGKLQNT